MATKACANLLEAEITTAGGDMPLIAVIAVLMAEYMVINSGSPSKRSTMEEMFTTLRDDDKFPVFKRMLGDYTMNRSSTMEMFEMMDEWTYLYM